MKNIQTTIVQTITDSRELLKKAYKDAFYCEGGCTCEFVEARFAHLIASYEEVVTSIAWYETEIGIRLNYFTQLDVNCPHHDDKDRRIEIDAGFVIELDAINEWLEDDFELEDVVDQAAFEKKYGFKYESSEFDRYFAGPDRGADYNQATETVFDF